MWDTPQAMVYLATGHHDMRKSINGLALVVTRRSGTIPWARTGSCSATGGATA